MTPFGVPLVSGLFIATVVVWVACEFRQGLYTRDDATSSDRGSRTVLRCSYMVSVILALVFYHRASAPVIGPAKTVGWIALCVTWCGIALRLWSFKTLGRYFTFTVQTSEDQPVIASGPYRVIRHPSYAGAIVAFAGVGLMYGNWWSFAGFLAPVSASFIYRINVEERALTHTLGDRYVIYAKHHKRLIPYLW